MRRFRAPHLSGFKTPPSLQEPRFLDRKHVLEPNIWRTFDVLLRPRACRRTVIACGPVSHPKAVHWARGETKADFDERRDNGNPMRSTVPDRAVRRFFHEPRRGESVVKGEVVLREREERGDIGMSPPVSSRMAAPNSGRICESLETVAEHPKQTLVTSRCLPRCGFRRMPSARHSLACSAGPMPLRHPANL